MCKILFPSVYSKLELYESNTLNSWLKLSNLVLLNLPKISDWSCPAPRHGRTKHGFVHNLKKTSHIGAAILIWIFSLGSTVGLYIINSIQSVLKVWNKNMIFWMIQILQIFTKGFWFHLIPKRWNSQISPRSLDRQISNSYGDLMTS